MKNSTLILIGGGGLLALYLMGRGKTAIPQGKVASTNSASTPPNIWSDLWNQIPIQKTSPDTTQTISAIAGVFGNVLKGLQGGGSKSGGGGGSPAGGGVGATYTPNLKRNSPQAAAVDNAAYDNLNTAPVDVYGDTVTSSDLGPAVPDSQSYDWGNYYDWSFGDTGNTDTGSYDFSFPWS